MRRWYGGQRCVGRPVHAEMGITLREVVDIVYKESNERDVILSLGSARPAGPTFRGSRSSVNISVIGTNSSGLWKSDRKLKVPTTNPSFTSMFPNQRRLFAHDNQSTGSCPDRMKEREKRS